MGRGMRSIISWRYFRMSSVNLKKCAVAVVLVGLLFIFPKYFDCENQTKSPNYAKIKKDLKQTVKQEDKFFITTEFNGRLGNHFFQYASLLGIAKTNNLIPYIPLNGKQFLTGNFKISLVPTESAINSSLIKDTKPLSHLKKFDHLPKSNITLHGGFQSFKYFDTIIEQFRTEFQLVDELDKRVEERYDKLVGKYVRNGREVISIHVRRGDYTDEWHRKRHMRLPSTPFFTKAMAYMTKRHPYSVFLVVSHGMEWCKKNIEAGFTLKLRKDTAHASKPRHVVIAYKNGTEDPIRPSENLAKLLIEKIGGNQSEKHDLDLGSPPIVFANTGTNVEDFGLLTKAHHSILTAGTFGWWGAWLANGEVVYFKEFLSPGSIWWNHFTKEDYYPPKWVAL